MSDQQTYILATASRQWPTKQVGDRIDLSPAAAKYLLQAGVVTMPEGNAATDLGLSDASGSAKRRKTASE